MTAQKPFTILLVEDSAEDRAVYRHYLSRNTTTVYTCTEATTGSEGIRLWQTAQPACIVLDFGLPDMTGLEFLHAMQATDGALVTPVVMLTGQGNEQLAVQACSRVPRIIWSRASSLLRRCNTRLQPPVKPCTCARNSPRTKNPCTASTPRWNSGSWSALPSWISCKTLSELLTRLLTALQCYSTPWSVFAPICAGP